MACENVNAAADAHCVVCGADRTRVRAVPPPLHFSAVAGLPPPRRRNRGPFAAAALVVVVAIGFLSLGGYRALADLASAPVEGNAAAGATAAPATTQPLPDPTPKPTTGAPTPTRPATVGMVDIRSVNGDPRAVDVATMFDRYFSGVNDKDYQRVLAVYDPAGVLNPGDSAQAAAFSRAVSTTTDSDVTIVELGDDTTGAGAVQARVRFTSHQASGYGPKTAPQQTCTTWDVTYVLTFTRTAGYRILRSSRSSNAGC
jgi:hypothetical protein